MIEYVAQRKLRAQDANGNITQYMPGDVIPNFESWNIHQKKAHLNLEWVTPKKDLPVPDSLKPVGTPKQEPKKAAPTELACDLCSKTYKDERSLKIHKTVKHKEE